MNEWISVDDMLPDNGNRVLVFIGSCYECITIGDTLSDSDGSWLIDNSLDEFGHSYVTWDVTHWMPLPEPPNK